MTATPTAHPSVEDLRAFRQGTAGAAAVAVHLASCAACREAFARLSGESHTDAVPETIPPAMAPAADLPPDLTQHPEYEVQRLLGRGGMGVVYLARNKLMDRLEVLKVISEQSLGRAGALERFLQEIRAAARLQHPNVVTAYSAVRLGGSLMLAMEYVEGMDLGKLVAERGPLPVAHACHYARQVALGLQQAHEQKLVHRDIKPNNLILGRKSVVKILDFGLAKVWREEEAAGAGLTSANVMMGTPTFMAPEQASDSRRADIRADIYSLGCTLYYLLTGRPPFVEAGSLDVILAHVQKVPEPVDRLRPEVPAALAAVVARMLAKDPGGRYQTPAEVARALVPFIKGEAKPAATLAPAPQETQPRERPPAAPRRPAPPKPVAAKRPPGGGRKVGLWVAGAAAAAFAVFLALWQGGALRVRTPEGVIVLENLPPGADVYVDGSRVPLKLPEGGGTVEIGVKPGQRKLEVTKGGFKGFVRDLEIAAGGRVPIRIHLEALPTVPGPVAKVDGFVPLFNGRDLTGWKTHPNNPGDWSVKDGILIGKGAKFSHLFSERGDYENFHFKIEAKISDKGQSGQHFRTQFGPGYLKGYEAQINSTFPGEGQRTGSLFRLAPIQEVLVPPDTWFTQEVIADGNHLRIKVNGQTVVDYTDPKNRFTQGHLAIQQHPPASNSPHSVIMVKSIGVKELPPTAKVGEAVTRRPGEVITVSLRPGVELKLAWVPPGESWLGGGGGKPGTKPFTLKQGLWCGVYPVTQAEWQAVMGDNPSQFKGNRYPVETVSWDRVQQFLEKVNQRTRAKGLLYRLPTEQEWEYICRGGPLSKDQSKYHFYLARPSDDLSSFQANFNGNFPAGSAAKGPYLQHPSDVGSYVPNPLGIYDLHGNIWQWTASQFEGGSARTLRGGSWNNRGGVYCTASYRRRREPGDALNDVGFRLLAVPTR